MKKINLRALWSKETLLKLLNKKLTAYTLAEVIIVMLIVAVIVAVSIGITKAKLDNIVSYTYYSAYSSLRKISTEMLADWDPTDPEYKQQLNDDVAVDTNNIQSLLQTNVLNFKYKILSLYQDLLIQPAYARCAPWATLPGKSCTESGGRLCAPSIHNESGCYACCTLKTPSSGGPISDCRLMLASTKAECNTQGGYWCISASLGGHCTSAARCCTNDGGNTCTKTCSSGYTLDKTSCTCKCSKTCGSGYKLNSSTCTCEKLPCTNKPSTIPCGQSWDENTCSLTGSVKTCAEGYSLDSSCNCKCSRTCATGYSLNVGTCTCEKNPCTNKPSTIPCGQSWDEGTCSLTGTAKTCSDGYSLDSGCNCKCTRTCGSGYTLNSSSCTCVKNKVPCWDGTEADSEAQCPGFVTCWNGSKAHNYGECPPCPNRPSTIPCGQSWDETTCTLTGTAKTCPSGQHLNSGCNCVNDCPSAAELTPCRLCSYETGVISKNMAINRTCSDETYEWSEEQCKCIISPRTLPRKGENFCKLFERHSNIMGNTDVCSGSVIADGTTNFADKKADITLRNGLRIYNMHRDATALSILAGNTQAGVYDGVPNTNSYGYTVYVDIDGVKGDSQLWSDVFPFYITLSGKIIPGYDSANSGISGGDSTRHLQVSVEYEDYSSGKRKIKWLAKSVPFKEGACKAGYVGDATPYCRNNTAVSKLTECTTDGNSLCRLKQIQPVKFFF